MMFLQKQSLQDQVFAWCQATFKGQTLDGKLQHLWEELHEVFENCANDEARLEVADCALLTMEIASFVGVRLVSPQKYSLIERNGHISTEFMATVREKFEICKARNWQKPDEQGVFHHVKAETNTFEHCTVIDAARCKHCGQPVPAAARFWSSAYGLFCSEQHFLLWIETDAGRAAYLDTFKGRGDQP